jgi:hypothetical protein
VELLLNLTWLAIAIAAVAAYLRPHRGERRDFLLGLGALFCVLVLLLPAISITDDLHFEAFAVEDSSTNKRLANAVAHANPASLFVWLAVSVLAMLSGALSRRTWWRRSEISFDPRPDSPFHSAILGRAPPA